MPTDAMPRSPHRRTLATTRAVIQDPRVVAAAGASPLASRPTDHSLLPPPPPSQSPPPNTSPLSPHRRPPSALVLASWRGHPSRPPALLVPATHGWRTSLKWHSGTLGAHVLAALVGSRHSCASWGMSASHAGRVPGAQPVVGGDAARCPGRSPRAAAKRCSERWCGATPRPSRRGPGVHRRAPRGKKKRVGGNGLPRASCCCYGPPPPTTPSPPLSPALLKTHPSRAGWPSSPPFAPCAAAGGGGSPPRPPRPTRCGRWRP